MSPMTGALSPACTIFFIHVNRVSPSATRLVVAALPISLLNTNLQSNTIPTPPTGTRPPAAVGLGISSANTLPPLPERPSHKSTSSLIGGNNITLLSLFPNSTFDALPLSTLCSYPILFNSPFVGNLSHLLLAPFSTLRSLYLRACPLIKLPIPILPFRFLNKQHDIADITYVYNQETSTAIIHFYPFFWEFELVYLVF
jgi:hypothetical protein